MSLGLGSLFAAGAQGSKGLMPLVWMGSGIINALNARYLSKENQKFQDEMAMKNQRFQEQMERNRQNFQRENFEKTAALQREICELNHTLRLEEQSIAFHNQKETIEYTHFMANWPLYIPPFILREESILENNNRVALRVILAKSRNNDSKIFNRLLDSIEHGLYMFLNTYYSVTSQHPVLFYSSGWKENVDSGVAVNSMIHYALKYLPTLIITPKVINNSLNLDISMWGLGVDTYYQDTLFEIPFEKKVKGNTIDEDYYRQYIEEIQIYFNYLVGWVADILHLIEYNQMPILPQIIMSSKNHNEHWNILRTYYKQRYIELYDYAIGDQEVKVGNQSQRLSSLKSYSIPDLSIKYIENTIKLVDDYQNKLDCIINAMKKWLEIRGIVPYNDQEKTLLTEVMRMAKKEDTEYLNQLREVYSLLKEEGYSNARDSINTINRALAWIQ
ncbi:MAG: hypothetical protein ACOYVK_00890 [Bacillota bacterium]